MSVSHTGHHHNYGIADVLSSDARRLLESLRDKKCSHCKRCTSSFMPNTTSAHHMIRLVANVAPRIRCVYVCVFEGRVDASKKCFVVLLFAERSSLTFQFCTANEAMSRPMHPYVLLANYVSRCQYYQSFCDILTL